LRGSSAHNEQAADHVLRMHTFQTGDEHMTTPCPTTPTTFGDTRRFAAARRCGQLSMRRNLQTEAQMGKYFLAWLLGVPASILVIVYLIMHH